ncbi:gametogenetin isoform X2 [Bicyclus anynana]|uniref:Gametogenetin isoform X2 n=1 Tax=Bicyclus anynana TaxID=110368 RepID=A0A6J1NMC1_BICAN|nr:gametogenetin isoform X2 [Bicyclus anynana]
MEKEHQPDSMATITMKPEYPPSEYSASEPPPAYRQRLSSSVQIARIAALTIIASSFILGSFILASSWVAARASCHQLEQLDAMLDKELALEGRSYGNDALMPEELPIANAHALHAAPPVVEVTSAPAPKPAALSPDSLLKADPLHHSETKVDEDKMQKIDDDKTDTANSGSDESSESDSSGEDDEDDLIRPMFKLPIQFDLDELAGAFLANSQKGRMNCVVERRNEEPMERRFPFNILGAFAPRSAQAERIAIICHGGDGERAGPMFPDPQSQVFAFPLSGPVRLPIRPAPAQERPEPRGPFGMPQRNSPFPLPMPWDSSEEQQMSGPREMRIHVQRVIAIPSPHNMPPAPESMGPFPPPPPPQQQENEPGVMTMPRQMRVIAIPSSHNMPPVQEAMGPFQPPPPPQAQDQNEQSDVLHQFVPQTAPTQDMEQPEVQKMQMEGSPIQMNLPWDLTPEDLHMIHRTAQEAVANQRREQQIDNDMQEVKTIVNTLAAAEAESEQAQAQDREQMPRAPRTLLLPQDMPVDQRPHYMQPRSVRSVDSPLHREKRVKRCSCACR